MQPLTKGGYIVDQGGNRYDAAGISPHTPREVWGHAPPENFGNVDSLRLFLRYSDSYFGAADLVAIYIMLSSLYLYPAICILY